MLKNYNRDGQKLPLFGIGPYMIFGMGLVTLTGITLMWHNIWMFVLPVINWIIMTIIMNNINVKRELIKEIVL